MMASRLPYILLSQWSSFLDKEIQVLVDSPEPLDTPACRLAEERLDLWHNLALWGAFPLGDAQPTAGNVATAPTAGKAMRPVGKPLKVSSMDYRALHVACNLLGRVVPSFTGVEFREIIHSGGPRKSLRLWSCSDETEMDSFPPLTDVLPFTVSPEEAADRVKGRRCLVEGRRPLGTLGSLQVIEVVDAWATVLEHGGYSCVPTESTVSVGSLHSYDEYAVELVFSIFEASESAWYSLANVLNGRSAQLPAIAELVIE